MIKYICLCVLVVVLVGCAHANDTAKPAGESGGAVHDAGWWLKEAMDASKTILTDEYAVESLIVLAETESKAGNVEDAAQTDENVYAERMSMQGTDAMFERCITGLF